MAVPMDENALLVEVRNLRTFFFLDEGTVRAVDGAEFEIRRSHTLGVVGESGCGKSVTAQSIMRIVPSPGKIVEGEILYHRQMRHDGTSASTEVVDLTKLNPQGRDVQSIRGNEIAMIFQEPMTALSPVHTVGNQIVEATMLHQGVSKAEARDRAIEMLGRVRMPRPEQRIDDYPFQLSGGMRQRAIIAMALSCSPSLLIADEPTTALDVTTEAQILELMKDLQEEMGMAIMYITHNLGVIAEMAEEVVVMYLGKVVERTDVDTLFYDPQHPYTQALLKSIPRIGPDMKARLETIKGMVPDPYTALKGCLFHPRCPDFMPDLCDQVEPGVSHVGPGHTVTCPLYG